MSLRAFSLLLALLVAGASVSPCTAAAVARADRAAPEHATGHAHGAAPCHGSGTAVGAQCPCGCSDDGPRSAASAFPAPWALPAPSLAPVDEGRRVAPSGRSERPTSPAPSRVEHVPIAA